MAYYKQKENKIVIVLFVLVILFFSAAFLGRDYILNYIDKSISVQETASNLYSDAVKKEFNINEEELLDLSLFEKEKFQKLKENPVSLPGFRAGKNNPFNVLRAND
jgi:hypothetical protein